MYCILKDSHLDTPTKWVFSATDEKKFKSLLKIYQISVIFENQSYIYRPQVDEIEGQGIKKFFEPNSVIFFLGMKIYYIHTTSIYLKYKCIYVCIDHTSLRKPDLKKRFLHSPTKKTWHKKSFTYSKKMNLDIAPNLLLY